MQKRSDSGFIAITSTILLFFILLLVTLGISMLGYTVRMNGLEAEYQARSKNLSAACGEYALLALAANREYAGNETLTLGDDSCSVVRVEQSGDRKQRVIYTHSAVQRSVTKLRIELEMKHMRVLSWREEL